jgi:chemotaxis-related protein WspB
VFRLRGQFVPVVDLGVLHGGTPSRAAYASRVVVVHYPTPSGEHRPLGLLAEQVTDVVTLDERDLSSSGVSMPETPWLGAMAPAGGGPIQLVHVADLLNGEARARLFSGEEPSGG